ncbi:iron transporter [Natronorubrum texcoconense]|uniref:Fe2+ transport protein n=1 Tax=Natronorubrum texcoconense TaxID=1095776 RepID=A0A1G9FZI4_9EURY|nr:iron transporter [Natronorubrum texcoconense]SDK93811.1 Fe2+ transport protein [Natronorubrum texcoconense]
MNRRGFLRGTAVAGTAAIAGCLERLGFEEQSAWSNPPLVENRPDAVYLPAGIEEMGTYGRATDGEYAVELTYTIPHRFWLVAGETERVDVDADDSMHLMLTVWDPETDTVLPVNAELDVRRGGDSVTGQFSPWPMLSQRMGFHYGDNISLPDEGEYTARIRIGRLEAERTGAFGDRFDSSSTLEIDFEFNRSDIHDLEFELIDEDRRGERDALELMDHSDHGAHDGHGDDEHADHGENDDHDHDDSDGGRGHGDHGGDPGHPPTSDGPAIDELPGDVLGTERSGDAKLSVIVPNTDRFADDAAYLMGCLRTPYNDVILPSASLRVTIDRDGSTVLEDERLTERIDHEYGHHYGLAVDDLESDDEITVAVDSPPQVSRHDGYETAFFEFEDVSFTV